MSREFVATLEAMREGQVMTELETQLRDIVASVRTTGKPGKLNLTLTVKPMKNAEPHMLLIADDIQVTLPKLDKTATFMYATDTGGLTRRDPRQPDLGFEPRRVVAMAPAAEQK